MGRRGEEGRGGKEREEGGVGRRRRIGKGITSEIVIITRNSIV